MFTERVELPAPPSAIPFFDEIVPALPSWRTLELGERGDAEWCALLDADDHAWAVQWPWFILPSGYAVRTRRKDDEPGPHMVYLHREVMARVEPQPAPGLMVDHRNGCSLDCRKVNLRWVTPAQNRANYYGTAWHTELLYSTMRA